MCDGESRVTAAQRGPISPPLPLVLVVISSRTGDRASETDRVRLAEVRDHSSGWGRGESEGGRGGRGGGLVVWGQW